MFCNQCGKDNKDGTKFCVQCGNPLLVAKRTGGITSSDVRRIVTHTKTVNYSAKVQGSLGKKVLFVALAILILILIAVFNIFRVCTSIFNVKVFSNEQAANGSYYMCETKENIYYTYDDSLYRLNKSAKSIKKISNKNVTIIAAADNGIYCVDSNNSRLYKVMDKSSELETVDDFSVSNIGRFFINGKYNYKLSQNCNLTKGLNSSKYSGYSEVIHESSSDYDVMDSKMYGSYLYITVIDNSLSSNSGYKFIRISLDNGKEEKLLDDHIENFDIVNKKIVYKLISGGLHVMDINGKNQKELSNIETFEYSTFFCTNDYIYANTSDGTYRYDLNGGNEKEVDMEGYYGFIGLSNGLGAIEDGSVLLFDFDCNQTAEIKP